MPPNEARNAVHVVQIFAHIMIATEAGKLIMPPPTAVIVMMPSAPLDDISAEKTIPNTPNHRNERLAKSLISKLFLIASTLSFINPIQMKKSQNQMISFAYQSRFSDLMNIRMSAQIPINGYESVAISNSLNQISAANNGSIGEPTLAPMITPIAFCNGMIPAPTKARMSSETSVLLCNNVVVHVPVQIAIHPVCVYFWRSILSFFPPRKFNACSKLCIP